MYKNDIQNYKDHKLVKITSLHMDKNIGDLDYIPYIPIDISENVGQYDGCEVVIKIINITFSNTYVGQAPGNTVVPSPCSVYITTDYDSQSDLNFTQDIYSSGTIVNNQKITQNQIASCQIFFNNVQVYATSTAIPPVQWYTWLPDINLKTSKYLYLENQRQFKLYLKQWVSNAISSTQGAYKDYNLGQYLRSISSNQLNVNSTYNFRLQIDIDVYIQKKANL